MQKIFSGRGTSGANCASASGSVSPLTSAARAGQSRPDASSSAMSPYGSAVTVSPSTLAAADAPGVRIVATRTTCPFLVL
jgi:hypothetical protein